MGTGQTLSINKTQAFLQSPCTSEVQGPLRGPMEGMERRTPIQVGLRKNTTRVASGAAGRSRRFLREVPVTEP